MPFANSELLLSFCCGIALLDPVRHAVTIPEQVLVACILKKNDGAG